MKRTVHVRVNGQDLEMAIEPNRSLLEMLRDELGLTGAKQGCGQGECGACAVLLDGMAVNACILLAVEADGREIVTIEKNQIRLSGQHSTPRSARKHNPWGDCH